MMNQDHLVEHLQACVDSMDQKSTASIVKVSFKSEAQIPGLATSDMFSSGAPDIKTFHRHDFTVVLSFETGQECLMVYESKFGHFYYFVPVVRTWYQVMEDSFPRRSVPLEVLPGDEPDEDDEDNYEDQIDDTIVEINLYEPVKV